MLRSIFTLAPAPPAVSGHIIPPYEGPKCPFYGFVGTDGFFMGEPRGNGCALTGEHSPCCMEMANEAPCWDKCPVHNTAENQAVLADAMDKVGIGPKVFWPPGQSSWEGIKLGTWFEYVMGRKFNEPPKKV